MERFAIAECVILTRPETARERVFVDEHTIAVVMTHNYLHDLELVKMLLPSPVRYLGILGLASQVEQLTSSVQDNVLLQRLTKLETELPGESSP